MNNRAEHLVMVDIVKQSARSGPSFEQDQRPPLVVLLVDDDPDCRLLLRDAVNECKVRNVIHEVSCGEDAVNFLSRSGPYTAAPRPDLIYLDIEMPGGIDGLETLRQIRMDRNNRDIPIVMMTGLCGEAEMKLASQYGANSFTLKPACAEQFLRTVLVSSSYWLTVHQYPTHHIDAASCRK